MSSIIKYLSCYQKRHDQKNNPLYDAAIVLGASYRKEFNNKDKQFIPCLPAKNRAVAGMRLLDKGLCKKLIFAGGKTQGNNYPSEAKITLEYLKKSYKEKQSLKNISLEETSKKTRTIECLAIFLLLIDKQGKIARFASKLVRR